MIWILIAVAVVAICYYFLVRPYNFWPDRGVKQGRPYPIVGDNWGTVMRVQSFADMVQYVYNMCPGTRYSGMYQFSTPTLVLRDPELIKQLSVKDFDHFTDHRNLLPENVDPFWSKNLFSLTGQRWRDMRSTLSPAFTSSKMRQMYSLIMESAEQFTEFFLKQDKKLIDVEMKDTFTRFTNDVIASTAFGIKCDSLGERDNEFYLMGKEATDFTSFSRTMRFILVLLLPKLAETLKIKIFADNVAQFFHSLVMGNIKDREERGIIRPDMIHLLMEARKHGLKYEEGPQTVDTGFATVEESEVGKAKSKIELTDVDITAQALIFFFAGFDSVSSLMCFMSYELGINPDIQEKLRQEIIETKEKCNGKLTYEALLGMKYMDMVVSETLRLWPTAVAVDRVCTKPYTIQPTTPEEKPVHLEKNTIVWLPIYALHRDPEHFPEPNKFKPERFNDENKDKIKPYTYIPFGSGPRACIGSRFALLEIKALYFFLLLHFEIIPIDKTQIPLQLNRKSFSMTAENGFWFGLKRINTVK